MVFFQKIRNPHFSFFMLLIYLLFNFGMFLEESFAMEPAPQRTQSPPSLNESKFEFKPGNALEILVFPDTTSFLNNVYPIDDNGYVFLPLVGKTKVSDKTRTDFVKFLQDTYSQYLRFPFVQVRSLIRVSVLGSVQKPGLYYIDPSFSLWDVIRMVGGPVYEDGLKKMRWERHKKIVKNNLIPYLESGQSLRQIGFQSGDQIWVPSPERPTFLKKVVNILPIITFAISTYTLIIAIQSGRIGGRTFF